MALNRNQLKDALVAVFEGSKANGWGTAKVADEMAKAIDAYVREGEVAGVRINDDLEQVGSVKLS